MDPDDEELMKRQLGAALRSRRTELNLTLRSVADGLGTAESSLSDVERGESSVSLPRLADWCRVLKILPADLFEGVYGLGTRYRGRMPPALDGRRR